MVLLMAALTCEDVGRQRARADRNVEIVNVMCKPWPRVEGGTTTQQIGKLHFLPLTVMVRQIYRS